MGTRSGDIDPGIVSYLSPRRAHERRARSSRCSTTGPGCWAWPASATSGGCAEMIESGDGAAQLAYDVFIHRLRKYIGAYLAVLGHTDVITFTAGIGENDAAVRRDALAGLDELGIVIDDAAKLRRAADGPRRDLRRRLPDRRAGGSDQRRAGHRPRLCERLPIGSPGRGGRARPTAWDRYRSCPPGARSRRRESPWCTSGPRRRDRSDWVPRRRNRL